MYNLKITKFNKLSVFLWKESKTKLMLSLLKINACCFYGYLRLVNMIVLLKDLLKRSWWISRLNSKMNL